MWQGYWQSAIAAKPSAAHTGYLMGGLMWFCIPFTLATTMGLAALALDLPITLSEAGSGAHNTLLTLHKSCRPLHDINACLKASIEVHPVPYHLQYERAVPSAQYRK